MWLPSLRIRIVWTLNVPLNLISIHLKKETYHINDTQKYRFFGILPVFWKNTGDSDCISENYAQTSILMPSFRAVANFRKNTGFSEFYRYFEKIPEILCVFLKHAQRFIPMQSFRVIKRFLQKYWFFVILPVFWKNARNSDKMSEFNDQNYPIRYGPYLKVSRKSANFSVLAPNLCRP